MTELGVWQQSVLLAHRRTELLLQRQAEPPPLEGDSLGAVNLNAERTKVRQRRLGLTAAAEDAIPSAASPRGNQGFWLGKHAGKDTESGLGVGMVPKADAARGERFAQFFGPKHAGKDTKSVLSKGALVPMVGERVEGLWVGRHAGKDARSGLGPGMVPRADAARGERFANFFGDRHAGKDAQSGLGPGMVPHANAARGEGFADWWQGKHTGHDARSHLGPGMVPRHGRRAA